MPRGVYVKTEEHKQKLSDALKGRPSPLLGRCLSEEVKQKMSESGRGKIKSKETRKKMSEALKGRPSPLLGRHYSEEVKKKVSIAKLGRRHPDEARKKMSESHKGHIGYWLGKHHTEETKEKLSKIHLGMHHTEKTCEKMAKAHQGKPNGRLGTHPTEEAREKMRLNHGGGVEHHTEETKQKIREANLGHVASKETCEKLRNRVCTEETREKLRFNHGGGAKRSLYNGTWFRSGWEAKYAKYLDEGNIKWEYESHTFLLEIQGKKTSYTPDFYLPKFGVYHEVKGWTRPGYDEMRKIQPVKEQYGINLTVIDKAWLKRIGII